MPTLQFLNSPSALPLGPEWHFDETYPKRGQIYTEDRKPGFDDSKVNYVLVGKAKKEYGTLERITRLVQGILLCLFSFGMAYSFSFVRKLIHDTAESIRPAVPFDKTASYIYVDSTRVIDQGLKRMDYGESTAIAFPLDETPCDTEPMECQEMQPMYYCSRMHGASPDAPTGREMHFFTYRDGDQEQLVYGLCSSNRKLPPKVITSIPTSRLSREDAMIDYVKDYIPANSTSTLQALVERTCLHDLSMDKVIRKLLATHLDGPPKIFFLENARDVEYVWNKIREMRLAIDSNQIVNNESKTIADVWDEKGEKELAAMIREFGRVQRRRA